MITLYHIGEINPWIIITMESCPSSRFSRNKLTSQVFEYFILLRINTWNILFFSYFFQPSIILFYFDYSLPCLFIILAQILSMRLKSSQKEKKKYK